jgi:hypothetical protein
MSFSLRVGLQAQPLEGAGLQANNVSVGYAGYRAILFCDDEPCRISATGAEYMGKPYIPKNARILNAVIRLSQAYQMHLICNFVVI